MGRFVARTIRYIIVFAGSRSCDGYLISGPFINVSTENGGMSCDIVLVVASSCSLVSKYVKSVPAILLDTVKIHCPLCGSFYRRSEFW